MMRNFMLILVYALVMVGCGASTVIESSWKDPAATTKIASFKKVLVVAFAKDEMTRRSVEDQLVNMIGMNAETSYNNATVVKYGRDTTGLSNALDAAGFDGALVMRLVDKEKETNYVPGSVGYVGYGGFRSFYGYGYGMYSSPGYYVQDKIYHIQTNVFDLKSNKMIWSAITGSTNPTKLDRTVSEIGDVLAKKMRADGL